MLLRLILVVVVALVVYFGVTFVQIYQRGREHTTMSAQAILVFGTAEDNGTPSPELALRLNHALELYRQHRAPWMAVTGGKRPGDAQTEGQVSRLYLIAHGVPASRILVGAGVDTWENVSTVLAKLREHHISSVITVTDPFHEYRAMATASAQGLTAYPSPVSNSPTSKNSLWRYYLNETIEVGVARVVGYGRLSAWARELSKIPLLSGV
ncbi:MAG: YdcF family protein [Acidimicrobiales bacterium]